MKFNYKKAFTLLELLISISIIIVVFSLSFRGKKILDATINNIKAHTAVSNMCDFLSYSKFYCNKNNSSVIINCRNKGYAEFVDPSKKFSKKLKLPKGFNFITNYSINCSNEGVLSSGSIYICDSYNNFYKITISVGVDTINVYYGE